MIKGTDQVKLTKLTPRCAPIQIESWRFLLWTALRFGFLSRFTVDAPNVSKGLDSNVRTQSNLNFHPLTPTSKSSKLHLRSMELTMNKPRNNTLILYINVVI